MTAVKRSVKGTKKIVGRTKKDYVITACFYIILALVAAICSRFCMYYQSLSAMRHM